MNQETEHQGVIGESQENGLPVTWRFVNESPSAAKRDQLSWLTVIAWKYDGDKSNGMPTKDENERMIALEDILRKEVEKIDFCEHAYNRTGNNLKEFVYYIHDKDRFMETLNQALRTHSRYPIDITFYKDPEWEDFHGLLKDFKNEALGI